VTVKLQSPHVYPERFLLYGGGGAGKTEIVLNIASHLVTGKMYVLDGDYSDPYTRALETTYTDCMDIVDHIVMEDDWVPFTQQLADMVDNGDPEVDWLVIDPCGPITWDMVQDWYLITVYGEDVAAHLTTLRQQHAGDNDLKAFHDELSEHMNWPVIKKEYGRRLWNVLRRWHGNLIITAEAKKTGSRDEDDEKMLYGPIGYKPAGERRMTHVGATNLFLDHPRQGVWRATTVKDRNRDEMDKVVIDDFGLDYLVEYAGWEMARK